MRVVQGMLGNYLIIASLGAWAIAQMIKVVLNLMLNREFDSSRILGSGGMPSSHSASVCAMATAIGFREGFSSSIFALAMLFAVVVMYDAAGVRRSTGKNAAVINHIVKDLNGNGYDLEDEEQLKELVGHTPLQVAAGALLGIIIGTIAG